MSQSRLNKSRLTRSRLNEIISVSSNSVVDTISDFIPAFSAKGSDWSDLGLPLNESDTLIVSGDEPTLGENHLIMGDNTTMSFNLDRNLLGCALVLTGRVTGSPSGNSALFGFGKAGSDYLTLQARTAGQYKMRLRLRDAGSNTNVDPFDGATNPDYFGDLVTYVIRFDSDLVRFTVNDTAMAAVNYDSTKLNVDTFTIGGSEPGLNNVACDFMRVDILTDYTVDQLRSVTGQHASEFGTAVPYETDAIARKLVVAGDSVASGLDGDNGNGFLQAVRWKMLPEQFWTNNQEVAYGGSQVAPTVDAGMNAAQLAHCFSNMALAESPLVSNPSETGDPFFNDCNVLIVEAGVNDYDNNVPIGPTDSLDDQTFCGAFNLGVTRLLQRNPTIQMLFCGPFYRQGEATLNSSGHALQDYRDALVALCDRWSVSFGDMVQGSGVNEGNWVSHVPDGIHPNQAYHDWATDIVLGLIGDGALKTPISP